MKSFYAHTQVIIWAQLVATFRVPATIFGQKLLPTAAGKKVLATRRATKNTLSAGKLNICLQSDKCKNSALIKFLRHNIVVLKAR